MEGQRALRVFLLGTLERFSNPVRPVIVTNAAWRVLQIRFELKDGMSETLVTDALGFEKTSKENVAMPPQKSGQNLPLKLRSGQFIPREMPVVKKGGIGFNV